MPLLKIHNLQRLEHASEKAIFDLPFKFKYIFYSKKEVNLLNEHLSDDMNNSVIYTLIIICFV